MLQNNNANQKKPTNSSTVNPQTTTSGSVQPLKSQDSNILSNAISQQVNQINQISSNLMKSLMNFQPNNTNLNSKTQVQNNNTSSQISATNVNSTNKQSNAANTIYPNS